ncbi:hypothetical protein OROMI_006256 [Orobanche minor]
MEVDTILDKKVLNKISIHVLRCRISECRDCSSSCCRQVLSMQTMVGWPKCFDPSLGSKLWILPPAVSRRPAGGTVTYVTNEFIEMRSDTSLAEAVKLLARHKVSAPVLDVNAPEDASWIDRYIGVVEFAGIVVWILHQADRCLI